MTSTTLYAIADQYIEACTTLRDSDLPHNVIEDTIEELPVPFEEKAKAVANVTTSMDDEIETLQKTIDKLTARKNKIEKRRNWLRNYLLIHMQRTGITKIESPYFTIFVMKNPERVELADVESIPKEYWVQKPPPLPEISKTLIKAAIHAGKEVPGAYLTRDERIEIKT